MNAIVIGASSGIGHAVARLLAKDGHTVYVTGRRAGLLEELKNEFPALIRTKVFDVTDLESSRTAFQEMCTDLKQVDLVIVNAGYGEINKSLDWQLEQAVIDTNVRGAAHLCTLAMHQFYQQNSGHLVGISSVAALLGGSLNPAYNASKAFLSNYLAGLRMAAKARKQPITVTDIRPGFVKTDMVKSDRVFWMQPLEKAAEQIYKAILSKKKKAYVTKRWRLMAMLIKLRNTY